MLKTIKVKKQLRLDGLIKYVWDNHLYPETFKSNFNDFAHFDKTGKYQLIEQRGINQATKFTVAVDEEINTYTILEKAVVVYKTNHDNEIRSGVGNKIKINEIFTGYLDVDILKIYALLDGELKLIWESDSDEL